MKKIATGHKIGMGILYLTFILFFWARINRPLTVYAGDTVPFLGEGTKEEPYLIQSVEELKRFRDLVNEGEEFRDCYFYQTVNLDLAGEAWTPIGILDSGHYFYGVYNGGGHYLENLRIESSEDGEATYPGFFGQLAGTVLNLGIESGTIEGTCSGSLVSHSVLGTTPYIINCYSRATVSGYRAGGIADNFGVGVIINCWFDETAGTLEGTEIGTIVSNSGILIDCFGLNEDFINAYADCVISPRAAGDEVRVNRDSQQSDIGMLYLGAGIEADMVIPWEWDGRQLCFASAPLEWSEIPFAGEGTREEPYLISTYEDLCVFRQLVNGGKGFQNTWFKQTEDIVIESDDWIPIGICGSGKYFWGVYDGNGHVIQGLTTKYRELTSWNNIGLFGQLGGVVANLGLEDVDIQGVFCGTFAAQAAGDDRTAAIINCYSRGTVKGYRVGGIADYFDGGTIANCISDVELLLWDEEEKTDEEILAATGGILPVSVDTKIYNCRTTARQIMPEAYRSKTSRVIRSADLTDEGFFFRHNIRTALSQELFANYFGVRLMQWELSSEGVMQYSAQEQYILLFDLINEYLLVAILLIIVLALLRELKKYGMETIWEKGRSRISAMAIISGVAAVFVDCAAIGTAGDSITIGRGIFILLINLLFAVSFAVVRRHIRLTLAQLKRSIPLIVVMAVVLALELMQFDITPRYDASLYYGSLVRGVHLFRLDLFSYIGAFVCWHWIQGSALLIAPLEFIFPGQMVGMYIANVVITEVTLVIMYKLLRDMIQNISPFLAALASAFLVLCPYHLGMFTYLSTDSYLAYYAIWLLYSYRRKNNLMVAFCGYLLFFSKITGGVFYAVFLIVVSILEVVLEDRGPVLRRIARWWEWSKCFVWMLPGILYLFSMYMGYMLVIQHFSGAYVSSAMAAAKEAVSVQNTLVQCLVFGFRWMLLLIIICAMVILLFRPGRILQVLNLSGIRVVAAAAVAGIMVILMLALYNGNAECPRYSTILNCVYAVLVPVSISVIFRGDGWRKVAAVILVTLFLVQTYWTIDPAILLHGTGLDTGEKTLYRLALDKDTRLGMRPGKEYSEYEVVCDLYAYNMEYCLYNGLIQEVMSEICPTRQDTFYLLDLSAYEFHLRGIQYKIYWNTRSEKMTYDGQDEDSILLQEEGMLTDQICSAPLGSLSLKDDFYLVVAERVEDEAAMKRLQQEGYRIVEEYHPHNLYGAMSVYHLTRNVPEDGRAACASS